jgi:hypothetical protein
MDTAATKMTATTNRMATTTTALCPKAHRAKQEENNDESEFAHDKVLRFKNNPVRIAMTNAIRNLTFLTVLCAAPAQTIPEPLVLQDGQPVHDAKTWTEKRRPELIALFEDQVYGKTPQDKLEIHSTPVVTDNKALDGKAIRKQVTIYFSRLLDGPQMHILLYLPAARAKSAVFLGLNFNGNQSVDKDPGILTNDVWVKDPAGSGKIVKLPPDDHTRGANAANWQVEKLIAAGYGLATVYYYDIEPDIKEGEPLGVRPLFADGDKWSALGAWAWGLSRAVDYLLSEPRVDATKIALMGHSRLGKAALWAAAQDPRFALVISNESGKGGASLLKRSRGETIDHLNNSFPNWFNASYKQYTGHPEKLPVDGNELLALIAPRPLYVASADGDLNSDPMGEFLSAANVGHVYALFGKKGLGTDRMPPVSQPIMHDVGYHVRTGKHDVTEYDWDQYIAFADLHWGSQKPIEVKSVDGKKVEKK